MKEDEKIVLMAEDGEPAEFYVLEETRIGGVSYLLVTDAADDEEEAECFILKDRSKPEDAEASYEFLEDGDEQEALWRVFAELMEGADWDVEK